eukprot:CAMPEP_0202872276 /NCGR_PEP_ID=MMETSP1391-20130828/20821_1 /ASSEMBLY_ACC=CAM_ASM_000867 /TAXON_ID=1034604 /ORGANISM="Chlamydomonas leiostraca, Strain SAG 11-49" /LENGTH=49 /DNA_ID= /DNA_START= /DNA_END= /DNA_ORIENTATION=
MTAVHRLHINEAMLKRSDVDTKSIMSSSTSSSSSPKPASKIARIPALQR